MSVVFVSTIPALVDVARSMGVQWRRSGGGRTGKGTMPQGCSGKKTLRPRPRQ
jgi:hypothetical protein